MSDIDAFSIDGNLLLEQITYPPSAGGPNEQSAFVYVDILNLKWIPVELFSPNAKIFDQYTTKLGR